jgi:hypothetical protein
MFSLERRIAFLISIPCFLHCAALAQSVALSAAPASGAIGGLTSFNLSVAAAGGALPVALQWTISYSPSDISSLSLSIAGTAASASKTLACAQAAGSRQYYLPGLWDEYDRDRKWRDRSGERGNFTGDASGLNGSSSRRCRSGQRCWRLHRGNRNR